MSRFFLSLIVIHCLQSASAENFKRVPSYSNHAEDEEYDNVHLSMVSDTGAWNHAVDRLAKHGYPSEIHYITTADGYILTTYRIPYGRRCGPERIRKRPVVVKHGILLSSNAFLLSSVEKSLGYLLADDCFDVWLPNARGNSESKNHSYLDIDSNEYWHFSWHEMGEFDDPAIIDYVLAETGEDQLHWIGFSQGTTEFFVCASLYPEETARKVRSMHAMAPVAFNDVSSPVAVFFSHFLMLIEILFNIIGIHQFIPESRRIEELVTFVCTSGGASIAKLCDVGLDLLGGYDGSEFDRSLFSTFIANDMAGSSVRQMYHYGQSLKTKTFREYDYGLIGNMDRYGSEDPPDYRLDLIQVKMYLYYSDTDMIAAEPDILRLHAQTRQTSELVRIPIAFNHFDYLFGRDVKKFVYDEIIERLNRDEW